MKCEDSVQPSQICRCVYYVFGHDHLRTKFENMAIQCIFIGYNDAQQGSRRDPTMGKYYASRNVVFDEASAGWSLEKVELLESYNLEYVPKGI
jgi:hypothetical protein